MGKKSIARVARSIHAVACSALLIMTSIAQIAALGTAKAGPSPAPTIEGANDVTVPVSEQHVFSDLHVNGVSSDQVSVTIKSENGELGLGTTANLDMITSNSNKLVFSGLIDDVNTALSTLSYQPVSLAADTVSITLGNENQFMYPGNGHVYEFLPNQLDWASAKTAAEARVVGGQHGYLATLTDPAEEAYVIPKLTGSGWAGASDATVEGDWRWVTGPEANTLFYQGNGSTDPAGAAVDGNYTDWSNYEPNNSGNEDCMEVYAGGMWNDIPCEMTFGSIIEYGTDDNQPTFNAEPDTATIHVTITNQTITVSTCDELMQLDDVPTNSFNNISLSNDIDCTGKSVEPLFQDNAFQATFDGHRHTISGVEMEWDGGNAGLFARLSDATIKNLHLTNGYIHGSGSNVGALAGRANNSTLKNISSDMTVAAMSGQFNTGGLIGRYTTNNADNEISHVSASGSVQGSRQVGGLIGDLSMDGQSSSLVMSSIYSTGAITIYDDNDASEVGGLVGYIEGNSQGGLTLSRCYRTSAIVGNSGSIENIGGLIGRYYNYIGNSSDRSDFTIENCYSQSDISTVNGYRIGGLIGYLDQELEASDVYNFTTIKNAYSSGNLLGINNIGGIIGSINNLYEAEGVSVQNVFSAGDISSDMHDFSHGLVGYNGENGANQPSFTETYYDKTTSGEMMCYSDPDIPGCTPIDTSENPDYFKNNHVRAPMNLWDFSGVWQVNEADYPTFGPEDDADGVSAETEVAAPNNGDANNDGMTDDQQANVTSFVDTVNTQYVTLAMPEDCAITEATAAAEHTNAVEDSGYNYPAGLINFSANCGSIGYTATVTQYYYGVPAANLSVRKYNPNTHGYMAIPGATITSSTIGGQAVVIVTYSITDGGVLDMDGTANGVIVDPAGLAVGVVNAPNTGLEKWSQK